MADPFRPANRGEAVRPRITAEWFNGVNQAVVALRGGNIDLAQQQLANASGSANYLTVRVVNKSGSDIVRPGGVLKLNGLNFSYNDKPKQVFDKPVLRGVPASEPDDDFVVFTKPLKNGQVGDGVRLGYVFCRLNYTDEDKKHEKAYPTSNVNYLTSGTGGARIIWRELEDEEDEATTGEQWALVLLGSSQTTVTATIAYGRTLEDIDGAGCSEDEEPGVSPGSGQVQLYNMLDFFGAVANVWPPIDEAEGGIVVALNAMFDQVQENQAVWMQRMGEDTYLIISQGCSPFGCSGL